MVEDLRARELRGLPLVAGGRSSGARVACRTAEATGAVGGALPGVPAPAASAPVRAGAEPPAPSSTAVGVPVLVVQGERDPFGIPPAAAGRTVALVRGDHGLKTDLGAVAAAAAGWSPGSGPPSWTP